MANTYFVDLAQNIPEEIQALIGELTVLFGRLEHMVLLAVKRKRKIPLREAQVLYKGYSIGSKLFGKKPCPETGEYCQNYNGEVGLKELSEDMDELKKLCTHIQDLTSKRNRIMHGLITTVAEETVVFHNKKIYSLTEQELWELKDDVINTITKLNSLVPIPGLHAGWVTGPGLDVHYDASAVEGSDPIVNIYKENEEKE